MQIIIRKSLDVGRDGNIENTCGLSMMTQSPETETLATFSVVRLSSAIVYFDLFIVCY